MPDLDAASSDGSISGSDIEEIRNTTMGPTSPQTQSTRAPWQQQARGSPSLAAPIASGSNTVQPAPLSPSNRNETLQLRPPANPFSVAPTGPNAKFRGAVQKVMRMNRLRRLGDDEPGVNVSSDNSQAVYGRIREQCSIEVIDYGPTKCSSVKLTNEQLADHIAHESKTRPLWAKVRWINIGGISFDVIKALAVRYKIHPLAIEDMLHGRQSYTSKADYYSKHIFVRLLCHTLREEGDNEPLEKQQTMPIFNINTAFSRSGTNSSFAPPPPPYASRDPSTSEGKLDEEEDATLSKRGPNGKKSRVRTLASTSLSGAQPWMSGTLTDDPEKAWAKTVYPEIGKPGSRSTTMRKYSFGLASMFESTLEADKQSSTQAAINELKKGERVEVKLRNLYVIMYRDGTLISIHQDANSDFFRPITSRVRQRDTLLRNSADASLLLQAMLDLVVDNAVKVVDRYHTQILKFERDILVKPKMRTVKALHVASGDLTMHKRTLGPIKTLIVGLRRYDLDRCVAQANPMDPGFDEKKITGFMSHKSKVYLADVLDHCEYILSSLEMFETITENLIAYTFNIVSYDMNTTMRTLTVATVIFFPLTFLTGYFGMNFQGMLSVQAHTERFFWTLAIPVMAFTVIAFNIPGFISAWHWFKKKVIQKELEDGSRQHKS